MTIVDISYFQSHQRHGEKTEDYAYIDFDLVAEYADAVILRAAYGMWTDPEYMRNRDELELRGVPLNAYGWCLPSYKPETQGAYVAELTKGIETVWLDIETVPRANYGILPLDHYLRFWDAFDRVNPNSKKGIYLNLSAANELPDDPRLLQFPLWLAAFGVNDGNIPNWPNGPIIPKPWARYDMWQYTDKGRILGIDGTVDLNLLHPAVSQKYLFGEPPIVIDPLPKTIEDRVIELEAENLARRREISALAASVIALTKPVSDPVLTPNTGKKYRVVEPATMFIADKGQLVQVTGMKLPEGHVIGIGTIQNWKAASRPVGLYGKVVSAPHNDQLGLWVRMQDLKVVI